MQLDYSSISVTSRYLKVEAVPSKNITRVINTTRIVQSLNKPRFAQLSHDDTYAAQDMKPKSNRMCSVYQCTVKSIDGVFLHKFPKKSEAHKK